MTDPADAVATYIFAKDGNRPHLMRRVFAGDAVLEMIANTDAISFPGEASGVEALEGILVRRFADEFENIYTFVLSRPTPSHHRHFPCHWLVGMSAKENGSVRVGCGRYDWFFSDGPDRLVEKLTITIAEMCVLPKAQSDRIADWLAALPYPWCSPDEVCADMPDCDGLSTVQTYLRDAKPIAPE
ncbi:MAG: hypothetical protein MPJ78_17570 [Hyphomicrobiaceae bacterium]|nr:hypothetical protein [Hyphomicrobiaceae bacterium]